MNKCSRIKELQKELDELIAECKTPIPRPMAPITPALRGFREVAGPGRDVVPRESFKGRLRKSLPEELKQNIYEQGREKVQLPNILAKCTLMQRIMNAPCNIGLRNQDYQQEYGKIANTSTSYFGSGNVKREIEYSILDSAMTHLIEESGNACLGGQIQLWLISKYSGQDEAGNTIEEHRIIPEATSVDLVKDIARQCASKQFIYIPMSAQWISEKYEPLAKAKGPAMSCHDCKRQGNQEICTTICLHGHAMSLIIDQGSAKSITLFEPNGPIVDHYGEIAVYLTQLFSLPELSYFKDFRIEEPGTCFPPSMFGPQLNSRLGQCAYFSTIFIALRVSCPELSSSDIVNSLLSMGHTSVKKLLRHWACFLVSYARERGIFYAAKEMINAWHRVIRKFARTRKVDDTMLKKLESIEQVAAFDVVRALFLLEELNKELG
jgi:hypothetical protein